MDDDRKAERWRKEEGKRESYGRDTAEGEQKTKKPRKKTMTGG